MDDADDLDPTDPADPASSSAIRARTPARILVGRSGSSYRTATQLDLREDHAAAVDAVHAEIDLVRDLGREFVERWGLFEVADAGAGTKAEYLLAPRPRPAARRTRARSDRSGSAREGRTCRSSIGDGLSAAAVVAQVPALLPLLEQGAGRLGLEVRPAVLRPPLPGRRPERCRRRCSGPRWSCS